MLQLDLTRNAAGFGWRIRKNRRVLAISAHAHASKAAMRRSLVSLIKHVQKDEFTVYDNTGTAPLKPMKQPKQKSR